MPAIDNEWKKLDMSSLAASFIMMKSVIHNIGTKWANGQIDEQFIPSQYISSLVPNNTGIIQYEPLSCSLDLTCKVIRLELRLKAGLNALSDITGWNNTEDILCLTLTAMVCLVLLLIKKLRTIFLQRNRAYKQILSHTCSVRRNEETLLVPPPYPPPEHV
jgi:hypothetical protein